MPAKSPEEKLASIFGFNDFQQEKEVFEKLEISGAVSVKVLQIVFALNWTNQW